MQTKVWPLEKRQVTTTLPDDVLRAAEEAYELIHHKTKFGKIYLEIANDWLHESETTVTKKHAN